VFAIIQSGGRQVRVAPGAVIARALGVRGASATLAWALAAVFAGLAVTFLAGASLTLTLLLVLAAGAAALPFVRRAPRGEPVPGRWWVFAAGALLLAVVGVYAVASSAVAARRREIGIRGALGASRREVVALVLRHGLTPVGAGLLAGVAVALGFGRALGGLLFGVTPRDPVSLVAVVSILTAAALAASYVPARRAARVDPIIALRTD